MRDWDMEKSMIGQADFIEGYGGYVPWGISQEEEWVRPTPGDISGDAIGVTFGVVDMP